MGVILSSAESCSVACCISYKQLHTNTLHRFMINHVFHLLFDTQVFQLFAILTLRERINITLTACCVIACHKYMSAWPTFIFGHGCAPGRGSPDVNRLSYCEASETLPWAPNSFRKAETPAYQSLTSDAKRAGSKTETGSSKLLPNCSRGSITACWTRRQDKWPQRYLDTKRNHGVCLIVQEDINKRLLSVTGD